MSSVDPLKSYLARLKPTLTGKFFYYCLPFRRSIVLQNMQLVFGNSLNDKAIKKLAQCFYGHMAKIIKETLLQGWLSHAQIMKRVELRGQEHILKAAAKNKGLLVLTGHLGNWELAPVGAVLNLKGTVGRFHCIRKMLSNKYIEKMVFERFDRAGIGIIPKNKSLRMVISALQNKEAVIFVLDQHSKLGREGILVDFFNHAAGTFRSLAKLRKETGAPVIPVSSFRLPSGRHVLEFHPEIEWVPAADDETEQRLNTQAYNHFIEEAIKKHPEQWIWMHKRWKASVNYL